MHPAVGALEQDAGLQLAETGVALGRVHAAHAVPGVRAGVVEERLVDGWEEGHALRAGADAVFGEAAGDSWISGSRGA